MKRLEMLACLLAGIALRSYLPAEGTVALYLAGLMALGRLDPTAWRLRLLGALRLLGLGALAGTWSGDWLAVPGLPVYGLLAALCACLPLGAAAQAGTVWFTRRQLQAGFLGEVRLTLGGVLLASLVRPDLTQWLATQAAVVLVLSLPWALVLWKPQRDGSRWRPPSRWRRISRSLARIAAASLIGSLPLWAAFSSGWHPVWYLLATFALVLLGSPWRTPRIPLVTRDGAPASYTPEEGLHLATLLLMTLPPESSAYLFKELKPEQVHAITLAISKLPQISAEQRDNCVRGFLRRADGHHARVSGNRLECLDDYQALIRAWPAEAGRLLQVVYQLSDLAALPLTPRPSVAPRRPAPRPALQAPRWLRLGLALGLLSSGFLLATAWAPRPPLQTVQETFVRTPLDDMQSRLQRWLDRSLGKGRAGIALTEDGCVLSLTGDAALAAELQPAIAAQLPAGTRITVVPTAEPPGRDYTLPLALTFVAGLLTWAARRPRYVGPPPAPSEQPRIEAAPLPALALEVGRGVEAMANDEPFAERIQSIRQHVWRELGFSLPGVAISTDLMLVPNNYVIKLRGAEVGQGMVQVNQFMAIGPKEKLQNLRGTKTYDPTYGMPCAWISPEQRGDAERLGCMIFDPRSVVATQLTEIARHHAHELLGLQEVDVLVRHYLTQQPALGPAYEVVGAVTLRAVLRRLLEEGVSIRDFPRILEQLAEHTVGSAWMTLDERVEDVRRSLRHTICERHFRTDRDLWVMSLECPVDDPDLQENLQVAIREMQEKGYPAILICPDPHRSHLSQQARKWFPTLTVLAQGELDPSYDVRYVTAVKCSRD